MNPPKFIRGVLRLRPWLLGLFTALLWQQPAAAQSTTYTLDNSRSLVWWQLDPHFGHLWATSCPLDRSWQPGEGHSAGHYINYKTRPKIETTNRSETRLPLFPRDTVRANCSRAVTGTLTTTDARRFANLKGTISVLADSITNGNDQRDVFARKYVYASSRYPAITFTIDSLTNVVVAGDSVTAIAVGTFELRGVQKPTRVQVRGAPTPDGLRVRGMFAMPASELRDRYGASKVALGLGVGMKLWDTLYMGFDLIMKERGAGD
jgi:polyisoprenoid-binding protein YceI